MPANSGSITGTVAHTHGTDSSDGGHLLVNTTGVTNMNAGSMGYYDASSKLQELAIGSASDTLTVSGGVPTWTPAAAGGAGWEALETFNGSTTSTLTATFATPYVLADYECLRVDFLGTVSSAVDFRVQCTYDTGLAGSKYFNNGIMTEAGTVSGIYDSNQGAVCPSGDYNVNNLVAGATVQGSFYFYENPSKPTRNLGFYNFTSNGDVFCCGGQWFEGSYTDISDFKLITQNGSWESTSQIRTFRLAKPT